MVHVTRTFTVGQPVDRVVAYLADFTNAVQWDPGTVRCTRVDEGPVRVGATWKNVSKVLGRETELDYRLDRLDDDHVTLVGKNKTATSTDDITVRAIDGGSEITYDATIVFNGAARFADPLMRLEFERLAGKTVAGIRRSLDG